MKDDLGERMKSFYETKSQISLTRRVPVIARLDGRAFHTFCKKFKRPYDQDLNLMLCDVMQYLCKEVQGVKFAQRHSDEISLLLTDYKTVKTDAFFDYNVQKMCSILAAMATAKFNSILAGRIEAKMLPVFDCRVFNIPKEDVSNYFYWRLLDCKRNSIAMLAQSKFSHKELLGKTCDEMQEMIYQKANINWNNIPQEQKSGFSCLKMSVEEPIEKGPDVGKMFFREKWKIVPGARAKEDLDQIISLYL